MPLQRLPEHQCHQQPPACWRTPSINHGAKSSQQVAEEHWQLADFQELYCQAIAENLLIVPVHHSVPIFSASAMRAARTQSLSHSCFGTERPRFGQWLATRSKPHVGNLSHNLEERRQPLIYHTSLMP